MSDEAEDIDPRNLFAPASEPQDIGVRLIETLPEFTHLKEGNARIVYLMRAESKTRGNRTIIGEAMLPRFQGGTAALGAWLLASMFDGLPDFMILIDSIWWTASDLRSREVLIYHELAHCIQKADKEGEPKFDEDGRPIWGLVGHDIEEFSSVVRRYGAWSPDVKSFIGALREGGAL